MNEPILFLHGLESGASGFKSKYLKKHFKNSIVPNLNVSVFDITKNNSILRLIITNYLFIFWTFKIDKYIVKVLGKINLIIYV